MKNNIKRAARTVIVDGENKTAILEVRGGEYYKIPGGAIETGETDEEAAKREALEESGCQVEIIKKLGEQQFTDSDPEHNGLIHSSVCYLAKKKSEGQTCFTDWEKERNFKLLWVSFDKAIDLFSKAKPQNPFCVEINKRDLNFIKLAKKALVKVE
jgi:ADP-ribose pyrophosphatase YjhB (NUDIX family)